MANIQPFDYQKSTNIEEHNQIVNKVNEIVQVINDVNLDTINSEIANLKANATATDTEIANIKNKDTTQDTEIDGITKNLVSNVTATFDNPSRELKISLGREASPSIDATVVIPASSETGQYSEGNGIKIQDYQISVDTAVVALKSDIPVVPDVTELTQRVTTLETEMPTKASVDDVNSKVAIAQGTENAGKVLGVGADGNVTPVNAGGSSGGDGWKEVDLNNWPTDWKAGDMIRVANKIAIVSNQPGVNTWTTSLTTTPSITVTTRHKQIYTFEIDSGAVEGVPIIIDYRENYLMIVFLNISGTTSLNNSSSAKFLYSYYIFNGSSILGNVTVYNNASDCFSKVWRKRAST